ncbi:MAG: alpha/beta hydrolase-fold protein [Gemmatimonadota bacterium]
MTPTVRLSLSAMVATLAAVPLSSQATTRLPAHQTFTLASHAVAERRVINVYLPPAYAASTRRPFPVLYVPDGGLAEDFPHVVISVDSLIRLGRIPATIVVGIENTERRRDMTGPTTFASDSAIAPHVGGSAAFRMFIRTELMPEIRRRYRTSDDTGIVGESLAGLFVVETFLLEPTLFRRYVAISPSLWWDGGGLVTGAEGGLAVSPLTGRTLYLTSANEADIVARVDRLAAVLRSASPTGLRWFHHPRPDLEHGTIYLGEGPRALATALH